MLRTLPAILTSLIVAAPAAAQPAAEMVVTTGWLASHLDDPAVVVINVDGGRSGGVIPGARTLPHTATLGGDHRLLPPDQLATALARAGARDDARIVLYGDSPMATGFVYMALASIGHGDRVSVLSGNIAAWRADGHPVADAPAAPATGRLNVRPAPDVVVEAPWVRERLEDPAVTVLDVRTTREWNGGHLPGATLVLWQDLFQDDAHRRFKSKDEIRALLERAGVIPGKQVVTYCAIGMRASLMYFAAKYVGHDARVYVGSWEDWSSRSGYPIVRR